MPKPPLLGREVKLDPYTRVKGSTKVLNIDCKDGSAPVTTEEQISNNRALPLSQANADKSLPSVPDFEENWKWQLPGRQTTLAFDDSDKSIFEALDSSNTTLVNEGIDNTYRLRVVKPGIGGSSSTNILRSNKLQFRNGAIHAAGILKKLSIVIGRSVDKDVPMQSNLSNDVSNSPRSSTTEFSLPDAQELKIQPSSSLRSSKPGSSLTAAQEPYPHTETQAEQSEKVLVIDLEEDKIYVATEDHVLNSKTPSTAQAYADTPSPSGFKVYQKVQIPSRERLEMFERVDDTHTLQSSSKHHLARILRFTTLPFRHRALHFVGMLKTLYLVNSDPVDEKWFQQSFQSHSRARNPGRPNPVPDLTRSQKFLLQPPPIPNPLPSRTVHLYDWAHHSCILTSEDYILNNFKDYQILQLPRFGSVHICTDKSNKFTCTPEPDFPDGQGLFFEETISFAKHTLWDQVLRWKGRLNRLYVVNGGGVDEELTEEEYFELKRRRRR